MFTLKKTTNRVPAGQIKSAEFTEMAENAEFFNYPNITQQVILGLDKYLKGL